MLFALNVDLMDSIYRPSWVSDSGRLQYSYIKMSFEREPINKIGGILDIIGNKIDVLQVDKAS